MNPNNTICFWFNKDAQAAARFYGAITKRVLAEAPAAGAREAQRALEAMMPMRQIDIATIEAVRRG